MSLNKRILIADDERDLREYLAKLLLGMNRKNEISLLVEKMRGRLSGKSSQPASDSLAHQDDQYEIYTAGNGTDALQMTKDAVESGKSFAVAFLDIRMPPGPNGLDTAKRIHEIDPNVEIVVMTAYEDHDRKTLSNAVPRPEKLLYIKKPFHSDEISQTAFCLISKWNAEAVERKRKSWLESIIKSMSKLKTVPAHGSNGQNVYLSLLKAIQAFTESKSAFIAMWNQESEHWNIKQCIGISDEDAEQFVLENSKALLECRATQSIENKYVLPLKRENFSAVAVLSDITAQNDPEWYNLLMLLGMTAGEILSNLCSDHVEKEQVISIEDSNARTALNKIRVCASSIKDSLGEKPEAAIVEEIIRSVEIISKTLSPKGD